jgi:hypothetical protein
VTLTHWGIVYEKYFCDAPANPYFVRFFLLAGIAAEIAEIPAHIQLALDGGHLPHHNEPFELME